MKTVLCFYVFCEQRTFIVITSGRKRVRAFAPGGSPVCFRLPYADKVTVSLSSEVETQTRFYHLSCPASNTVRIAFRAPIARQTLSLSDAVYGLPISGELRFRDK